MISRIPFPLVAILLLGVLAGAGCDSAMQTTRFPITADDELLSMDELARLAHMKVDRANGGLARLSDKHHTVIIFPSPSGAYVDGKPIGAPEDVVSHDANLYVCRRLAKTIQRELYRTTPTRRTAPPQPGARDVHAARGTVLLDAGHGGKDPGAQGHAGLREKDVVLAVTLALADRLRARGVHVKLTRSSDVFVSLDGRVAAANRARPDLFLSIHADANPRRSARGTTVYVPRRERKTSRSYQAGRQIAGALALASPNGRGVRTHEKNLRVLERTTCPAVLVELGFLTNNAEERLLARPAYRQRLAEALCDAIVQFLQE